MLNVRNTGAYIIFKREMLSYFQSPLAYIFLALFVISLNSFTLFFSRLLENGEASLQSFFEWHPWLYTMLIPALTMRLWSEEKRLGTDEILHTLPLTTWQLVLGKFTAAWAFTGLALLCTLPMWWTVNYLGNPDNGLIIAGFIGSFLMAGAYVAIGATVSSATSSHVIAFIIGVALCLLFTIAGSSLGNGLLAPFLPKTIINSLSQFGFATNFEDITQGFMSWRSLFYFISVMVCGLFINRLLLLSRNNSALSLPIILTVISFFCANIMANIWFAGKQFDFTSEQSFTLSDNTKNILGTLEEPLYVTLYYSEAQAEGRPTIQSYAHRVQALLKDYAKRSGGMVKLSILDPSPFTDAEQRAINNRITGTVIDNYNTKLYFGLTVSNSVDRTKVIAQLDPSRNAFLEYDVTRILYQLSKNERPTVGVISWLPMRPGMTDTLPQPTTPWVILTQMEALFNVEYFNFYSRYMHDKLDAAELDVLMVVHPFDMDERTARYIHDYVVGGGKAIFFVDGYQDNRQVKNKYSDMNKMFAAWGIQSIPKHVVADETFATRITGQDKKVVDEEYSNVTWLTIPKSGLNQDDVLTANLTTMQLPAATEIKTLLPQDGSRSWTPLIISSKNASLVPAEHLDEAAQVNALLDNFESQNKHYSLAGRMQGVLPDFFASDRNDTFEPQSADIIVIGDADMLRDDTWVHIMKKADNTYLSRFSDNGAFVLNALDAMTGAEDLIALRSRSQKKRYFTHIQDMQQASESKYRAQEKQTQEQLSLALERLDRLLKSENKSDKSLLGDHYREQTSSLRSEILTHQKSLRNIRIVLHEGIISLSKLLIFLNIGALPLFIMILAFILPARLRRQPNYSQKER